MKAKSVAVVWVNNDFGKGGRDNFTKEMNSRGIKVVADISTESGQADFAADVVKVKAANADAIFVYTNEEESARFLREARKQGLNVPLIGETTLLGQKVIELAGDAANGARGHVGLTRPTRRSRRSRSSRTSSRSASSTLPDHNGIKGYTGVYMIKYVTEEDRQVRPQGARRALHGLTITPKDEPGILIETRPGTRTATSTASASSPRWSNGKQKITATLPKLGK